MSKMKQIAALTAMLVGVIMYASPAKSAVCFLPDDDGSCGGGDIEISDGSDSDDNKTEEKCEDFPVSATEYEKMKNCFDFTPCTKSKTNEVKYKKGAQKENTTWSNGICCTNGEKYFSKQGQCCPTTGCACSGGRVWNPSTEQCECPDGKEFVGGVCTCKEGTIPDGTGCKISGSCEDNGKHTTLDRWTYDCATSGEGTPAQDDDGCWICKQCTCPEGWSSSSTCPTKAGYTCVTEKTADTCGRADKCFKYSYGKSCLNKLAQDDLDNNNYTNLSIKRISTNKNEACPDGYVRRYTGAADDWGKACYICALPTCKEKGYINETTSCSKTKVKIDSIEASDGPCYACTSCEDHNYITITKDNYNELMKKCIRLENVKVYTKLPCVKCVNDVEPNDKCVTTATTGEIANGSTVYFYGSEQEYSASKAGTCIGSMTITAECKDINRVITDGNMYENGKSYVDTVLSINGHYKLCDHHGGSLCSSFEYRFVNDVIVCEGCSPTVKCKHKWGGGEFTITNVKRVL